MIADFITYLNGVMAPPVSYAWTSNPVEDESTELPAIFVLPASQSSAESEFDNFVRQEMVETVACLVGCKIENYETLRATLRTAVLGWTFEQYDAFEFESSETLDVKGGYIWTRELFTTRLLITQS